MASMELTALPVKRMVLYKHGVGYIERAGKIKNKKEVKLSFKKELMNDILKSLLIFSKGKGKVTGVSYETPEDISKLIEEKAIRVPEKDAAVGLFRQLKGYEVELKTNTEKLTGKILGTQEPPLVREQQFNIDFGKELEKPIVVVKTKEGNIRNIIIDKITEYKILDPEAVEDLEYFLDAVTSERKKNVKAVRVFLDGGDTELNLSYIMQIPSWRVSYRLVNDSDNDSEQGNKPKQSNALIQGWGIIDNQLDEDLLDVNMSLVAGKPISFIYDLYTPPEVKRPLVKEQLRGVSAPIELESGLEEYEEFEEGEKVEEALFDEVMAGAEPELEGEARMLRLHKRALAPAPSPAAFALSEQAAQEPGISAKAISDSLNVQTKSLEMGEFFKYDITQPVTVKRGQSAMVPIIQTNIECTKEHVYNVLKMPKNPMVTLRIKNNTGMVLERGPVVVVDNGTYVGEAILPYTIPLGENHIAYSVDMSVNVIEDYSTKNEFKSIEIKDGYMYRIEDETITVEYKIENKNKKPVELIIEHMKDPDYELVKTEKPIEETESYYRWKCYVKGKAQNKFKVRLGKSLRSSESIRTMSLSTAEWNFNKKYINKPTFEFLKEVIDLRLEIDKLDRSVRKLDEERKSIFDEQQRIRENLKSLSNSGDEERLRNKYVATLETQENRLNKIEKEKIEIKNQMKKLREKMDKRLKENIFDELLIKF